MAINAQIGGKFGKINVLAAFLGEEWLKIPVGIADAMNAYMTSLTKATPVIQVGDLNLFKTIIAKVRAAIEAQAPMGYQDETGFHTGIKPRGEEAFCPSNW
jgi:hypothetical protein